MSRLLIVDDEQSYCRQLDIALSADDCEVATAASGRQAIDIGARFRPDVIVTDWMLRDDIHGLHVSQVLRVVVPDCQTVLITGFPSDDLRAEAGKLAIAEFIEKPFTLERIREAVRGASVRETRQSVQPPIAVLEVSASGKILFANPRALEMFADEACDAQPSNIADLFSTDMPLCLDSAVDRWVAISPRSTKPVLWHVRAQPACKDRSRLVVLRRQSDPQHMTTAMIDMLLGLDDVGYERWPVEGRVLLVSDIALARKLIVPMLEGAGAGCYGVGTADEAERLLLNDDGIQCVVLDFDRPNGELEHLVERVRAARDDIVIVGSSSEDRRCEFARVGVELFLLKPWRTDALANLLTGRIGNCLECGLPLPIRCLPADDSVQSWACVGCGARYAGVFDTAFPDEFARNAARVE